jgi:hypothetical protein
MHMGAAEQLSVRGDASVCEYSEGRTNTHGSRADECRCQKKICVCVCVCGGRER